MRGLEVDSEAFRRAREQAGITQEQLADYAQCHVSTVRKAERGERLDLPLLSRLASILEVDISTISKAVHRQLQKDNINTILAWDDAFFARDLDLVMSFHHWDVELSIPGSEDLPAGGNYRGRAEVRRQMEETFTAFDEFEQHSRQVHADEDFVFLRSEASFRIVATGNRFKSHFLNEFQLRDGLIFRRTVITDYEGLRRGLER